MSLVYVVKFSDGSIVIFCKVVCHWPLLSKYLSPPDVLRVICNLGVPDVICSKLNLKGTSPIYGRK